KYEEFLQKKTILEALELALNDKIKSLEAEKGRNEKKIKCLKNDLKQIHDESDVVEKRLKKINDN
ncbi:7238_t:CDS:1, partial [Racocetra persica]